MIYRREPTPLHAARAAAGVAYCGALVLVALLFAHPLVLGVALLAVAGAVRLAGVGRAVRPFVFLAAGLGLLVAVLNPLFAREGLTVIARLGEVPALGPLDVTLEATLQGAVLGLRAALLVLCFALYSAAVDPDGVLRLFRRAGFRSALTATLATRLVPVLTRDARRLAEARRCRPAAAGRRRRGADALLLARALSAGAIDRSLDVAATLELRGYGGGRRWSAPAPPWSRHDVHFLAAAVAIAALAVGGRLAGAAPFAAYPSLEASAGAAGWALCAVLLAAAWLPFADRRGVAR